LYVEQDKDSVNHPEFRNWFYVYKNFSVEPDYKAVLQQSYLTEVKDVERPDRNAIKEEAEESMEVPESAQYAVDAIVQEENINGMKSDRQESDDSMAPEKLEDPILPENGKKKIVPSESNEGDKMPEKVENPITSESEEIMQVSEDDVVTKPNKGGPLKIVFPIPLLEKLKMRKMHGERAASPFGTARTMQEEMLGKDDKKKDEKVEGMKDDMIDAEKRNEMKEESMNEDKEIPSDDKKEENVYEIKDEIKNDKIKEDEKMEVKKEEKKDDKLKNIKDDQTEAMEGDKTVTMKEDTMEPMKDDKMEAMKGDKMEAIKDDKMEGMKDDKIEGMKDDKMEVMKGEILKDENKENDKKDAISEGIKNKMMKDDSKKEGVMTEDKDIKRQAMMAGDRIVAPIKEEKEAMLVVDRKVRHLDLSRLSRESLQPDDITSSFSSSNLVRKDTKSECIFKTHNGISKPVFMSFQRKLQLS
jgi:hypothetical protein